MRDRDHEFANRRDRLWTHTSTSQERWIEHPRRVRRPGRTTTYPDQPEYQWHTYQHGKSRRRPPGKLARTFQAPKPTPESSDPLHHRNRPQPQAGHHQRCSRRAVAKGRQLPSLVMLALQHRPGQAHRCPRRLMRTCTSRIQCPIHCMLEHRSPPGRGTLELYPERTRYSAVRRQNMHRRDTPERSSRRGCYSSWRRSPLTSLPLLRVVPVHSRFLVTMLAPHDQRPNRCLSLLDFAARCSRPNGLPMCCRSETGAYSLGPLVAVSTIGLFGMASIFPWSVTEGAA